MYPVSCGVSVLKAPVSLLLVEMVWSTIEVFVEVMVGSSRDTTQRYGFEHSLVNTTEDEEKKQGPRT